VADGGMRVWHFNGVIKERPFNLKGTKNHNPKELFSFVQIHKFRINLGHMKKKSKIALYCPSIHRQTRVPPRISAVPFSVCSKGPTI
jgi:hypothetical protein